MTSFDRKPKRIIVRAVYDGPGHAGKTTNLKQLVAAFTTQRRGELQSPDETDGRTVFFDWLHLDGGVVGGHPLRCELLTVPGQSVIAKRRWHVLHTADVVVFVCDSTAKGVKEGRRWLELLRARTCEFEHPPPLIVQANKQDLPGALDASEVALALDLPKDVPILGARAAMGVGVRETVVLAIRAAANRAQRQVLSSGIDALPEASETPDKLMAQLRALEVARAPRWMRSATRNLAVVLPNAPQPSSESDIPIPMDSAPSGFIWPATTGRDVLRAVATTRGKRGMERMESASGVVLHRCGEFRLATSTRRRHWGVDDARAGLLQVARRTMKLGSLNVDGLALALSEDQEKSLWLWTVGPWLDSMSVVLSEAAERNDDATLTRALRGYTNAVARAMDLALREQIVIDVDPAHFAMQLGEVRYFGEVASGADVTTQAHTWLEAILRYAGSRQAVEAACGEMFAALGERPLLASMVMRAAQGLAKAQRIPESMRAAFRMEGARDVH